jgi:hypothetical protein
LAADADGLLILRWKRYEAESYLVHPTALLRIVSSQVGLAASIQAQAAEKFLEDQLPPALFRAPLKEHEYWESTPVSKSLLPGVFRAAGVRLPKEEYYRIAEQMLPNEVPAEISQMLDEIATAIT